MTESRPPYHADGAESKSPGADRYRADSYDAGGYDADGYDQFGYDVNGLDRWGVTLERKERAFAKLASRFEEQGDSMAALLREYRRQEGISQENLLARLEITPAQYAHLALCFVPDAEEKFQSDILKIVEVSGANLLELATICRQVYALRDLPKRSTVTGDAQTVAKGTAIQVNAMRAMAARDRQTKALREEAADYSASVNADMKVDSGSPAPMPPAAAPMPEDAEEGADQGDTADSAENGDEDALANK